MALRQNLKLAPRFYGPYPILVRIRHAPYSLGLRKSPKIHPVFYISQLKKILGAENIPLVDLPIADSAGQFLCQSIPVVDSQTVF